MLAGIAEKRRARLGALQYETALLPGDFSHGGEMLGMSNDGDDGKRRGH